jgi:hypothetical protein
LIIGAPDLWSGSLSIVSDDRITHLDLKQATTSIDLIAAEIFAYGRVANVRFTPNSGHKST